MGIVRFTPLARNDLKTIRDFIALDKPKAASQYMSILKQHCQRLADFPLMGIQRAEYYGLYKFPVDDYLIFYRPSQTGVEVLRVIHSSRDIEPLLKPDESGSRYFCRKIFSGLLLEKIGKNHATAYAFGAPIRPRHLVSTQQGDRNIGSRMT